MKLDPMEPLVLLEDYATLPVIASEGGDGQLAFQKLPEQFVVCETGDVVASPSDRNAQMVAVVPLWGMLTRGGGAGTSLDAFAARVTELDANPNIAGIVVHTKSPGGTVSGTRAAVDALRAVTEGGRTRTVAFADGLMASGALWLGTAAKKVLVAKYGDHLGNTAMGSIGVMSVYQDASEAMEKNGIKTHVSRIPEMKARFNSFEPMTEEMSKLLADRNAVTYGHFLDAIHAHRGIPRNQIESRFGNGEMVTPEQAVEHGLADSIATLQDAIVMAGGSGNRYTIPRSARAELAAAEIEAINLI